MERQAPKPRSAAPAPLRANPRARNTVIVGSKLPHALILRLFDVEEYDERNPAGQLIRSQRAVERTDCRITINGANSTVERNAKMPLILPYARTEVPADFWDAWIKANAEMDIVKRGLIFAEPTESRAIDRSKEQRAVVTGFEAIDRSAPEKRMPGIRKHDDRDAA